MHLRGNAYVKTPLIRFPGCLFSLFAKFEVEGRLG